MRNYTRFDEYSRQWLTEAEFSERAARWRREQQEADRARFAQDAKRPQALELLEFAL